MIENITVKDHDDECHMIDITVTQQSENLKLIGELNQIEK